MTIRGNHHAVIDHKSSVIKVIAGIIVFKRIEEPARRMRSDPARVLMAAAPIFIQ